METTTHPDRPPSLLIGADELARMLGISVVMLRRMRSAGKLPQPVRLNRRVLWRLAEVEAWVAAGCPAD